ncbi:hypothetical protein HU830_00685 [Lactobacillus sp. DCY120]|uniref:Uncharacterized protein n=1 Tax=Bombilactobacillus apium TaxID=2675299 RepID=A0A850R8J8_9LACO|nr:SPJ_0845 family protein [Bombilactobacillus apium]NVY95726.1 hypothetical protein [Bombilactobacillus apium]
MGLTVKRENDFGSLFDKFASLPEDLKQTVEAVDKTKKTQAAKKEQSSPTK